MRLTGYRRVHVGWETDRKRGKSGSSRNLESDKLVGAISMRSPLRPTGRMLVPAILAFVLAMAILPQILLVRPETPLIRNLQATLTSSTTWNDTWVAGSGTGITSANCPSVGTTSTPLAAPITQGYFDPVNSDGTLTEHEYCAPQDENIVIDFAHNTATWAASTDAYLSAIETCNTAETRCFELLSGQLRIEVLNGPAGNVIGYYGTGQRGCSGDGGPASEATFGGFGMAGCGTSGSASAGLEFDIAADGAGDLFIADPGNSDNPDGLREVTAGGVIESIPVANTIYEPAAIMVDGAGDLFIQDYSGINNEFSKIYEISGIAHGGAGTYPPLSYPSGGPGSVNVTSSANPSVVGGAYTATVGVVPVQGEPPPSGSVTLYDNGTKVGTASLGTSGQATFNLTAQSSAGLYPLQATYSGDSNYQNNTSPVFDEYVQLALAPNGSSYYGSDNRGTSGPNYCFFGDPVNCFTGNLSETASDLSEAVGFGALSFSRTYNALGAASASQAGPLGWGWTANDLSNITFPSQGGAVVNQGNGSAIAFYLSGSTYVGPASATATLVQNGSDYVYTLANQESFTYGANGQLLSQSDRNGVETTMAYNSQGQLNTVTDPYGRQFTFAYNSASEISSITDADSRTVSYGYNTAGDLTSVTDPTGALTQYGYDGVNRLTSMTNPNGGVTTNSYNASNQVISQKDPLGRVTTWSYSGSTTTITDPDGNVKTETFDGNGNLLSVTSGVGTPSAATSTYTYNVNNEKASATDPNGNTTSLTWDGQGNMRSSTDNLGLVTTYTYDADNDLTSVTDPMGNVTRYSYNSNGNLTTSTSSLGGQPVVTTLAYGASHPWEVSTVTDPRGKVTHYAYDADGDRTSATDPDGNTTTTSYNAIGWPTSTVSARGNASGTNPADFTTSITYDGDGRPLQSSDPTGAVSATVYDEVGNPLSVTDGNGNTTLTAYDPDNEAVKVTEPNGTATSTSYDADGNVLSQTDGNGQTTTYSYDPLGQEASSTNALGQKTTYGYDGNRDLTTETNPSNEVTTLSYDADRNVIGINYSDGTTPNVAYTYNGDQQRLTMIDGTGTTTYSYDSLGRLTGTLTSAGIPTGYSFDLDGNLVTLSYPSSVSSVDATYTYDAAGRMTGVTDWSGNTTSFGYDPNGNLTTIDHPDGSVDTYTFNDDDQVTNVDAVGSAGEPLYDLATLRDAIGNVTSQTSLLAGTPTATTNYSYDANSRLTGTTTSTGSTTVPTTGFSYDAGGNIASQSALGTLQDSYTYNAADELTQSTDPTSMTIGTTTSYAFNPEGERTSQTTSLVGQPLSTDYAWNQAGDLTGFAGPAFSAVNGQARTNVNLSYSYNGDGLLSEDVLSSLYYNLAGETPQIISNGSENWIRGPGGIVVEQTTIEGAPLYYHHDQLGSTRALTNQSGHVAVSYAYTPYGVSIASSTSVVNPFGFADSYTDPQSGFVYLINRWYDPSTGQFLSVDPLVDATGQAYSYAGDDPVNLIDPTGLSDCGVLSLLCDIGDFVIHHPLQTAALVTAGAATVLTDGATSGLLVDEVSVVASEDSVTTTISGTLTETAPVTSPLGRVAGGLSQLASAGAAGQDCSHSQNAQCLVDLLATAAPAVGSIPGALDDSEKVLTGLVSSTLGFVSTETPCG